MRHNNDKGIMDMAYRGMGGNLPILFGLMALLAGVALVQAHGEDAGMVPPVPVKVQVSTTSGMTGVRVLPALQQKVSPAEAQHLVEDYINGLKTMRADFTQRTTGEQFTQEGIFYLDKTGKSGKFLWDYQSPDRQRLIATGTALYFVDDERGGQVTQLPVKAGLSRLFTGQKLSLEKEGLRVEDAWRTPDMLTVRLKVVRDATAEEGDSVNQIDLTFARAPMALSKVEATDATNAVTTVAFGKIEQGVALDAKMFKFTPPQYKNQ